VKDTPDKVVVINRFQNNLDISLQQPRLHKKLGFFGIRHLCRWVWFSIIIKFESRALENEDTLLLHQVNEFKMVTTVNNNTYSNSRDHECDVIEVWQQERPYSGTISHMFDNSLYRFPTTLVHKVAWIVY
jgi:hypothetical protein